MTTHAFKFLAHGARGAVSGFAWPQPAGDQAGDWVDASGPLQLCRQGVHACRSHELAHWLHEELWEIELEGEMQVGFDCLIAARGRLVRRVEAWGDEGSARFAAAARDHAQELAATAAPELRALLTTYVGDASVHVAKHSTALAAFCAAMTVARLRGETRFDDAGYREERDWQSAFIVRDLGLQP